MAPGPKTFANERSDSANIIDDDLEAPIGYVAPGSHMVVEDDNMLRQFRPFGGEAQAVLADGINDTEPPESTGIDGLGVDDLKELAVEGEEAAKGGGLATRSDDEGVWATELCETDGGGKGVKVGSGVSDDDVEITDGLGRGG